MLIFAGFLALHSVALKVCVDTSGHAYEVALEKVRKLNREYHLNGTKPEDRLPVEMPSTWAPNAWASAALFGTLSLHAFFHLLCHWRVRFKASMFYSPATSVKEGCYVQVTPPPHRGQAALELLHYSESSLRLGFTFQRQRYEYCPSDDEDSVGEVRLTPCPVEEPHNFYLASTGLSNNEHQLDELRERYGDNLLEVEMPSFIQCYKEQLLTPLVIFQIFVALLWAADDFFGYTLLQLAFILIFESTSVMQRLRTMKMLNSMGTKSYGIMVYRAKKWSEISTAELYPGDLVELRAYKAPEGAPQQKVAPDIVPCDCVILRGDAVASEASLTGESAPQMKDALDAQDRRLDLQGVDRVHCLFSGTRLLRSSEGGAEEETAGAGAPEVPSTPGGGCLCFVVRTGFASSQGHLLQMIEFSQDKVSGDTKEVIVALLILLAFALVAAGYVLKTGLEKGEKTPHELLIKCVIILTAVVPRQLPLQMAVAVNTALMALGRVGVFCTEPYRVPFAGKVSHCLFDKTGTLTTDTLIPVGIVNAQDKVEESKYPPQVPVHSASPAAAAVLAACHSLVAVEGQLTGDPIEVAALEGLGWRYDAESRTSLPQQPAQGSSSPAHSSGVESVHILQRFHFASHLQRMAVVADVKSRSKELKGSGIYSLVKGSPEALKPLLAEEATPTWFDRAHTDLAERGLRVLALAWRRLPETGDAAQLTREEVECKLHFAGFIAFECLARADSRLVMGSLRESGHKVAMLTGDSPLTALHIAHTCSISDGKPGLLLSPAKGAEEVQWTVATGERRGELVAFSSPGLEKLALEYTLMTTGEALDLAARLHPSIWEEVDQIAVFARMTPQGKAAVIQELQHRGRQVLMCGDGGNDVGALKQADVGLALLAGYGNVNTTEATSDALESTDGAPQAAEEVLNEREKALAKRTKKMSKERQDYLWAKQKELNALHPQWLEEETKARAERGDTGLMAQAGAVKTVLARYTAELNKEMLEYDRKHGNIYDTGDAQKDAEQKLKESLESMGSASGLPMVRPGDASVAAPFTSKAPSVKSCVDLIRQGRCTLLSALQQQQIMMLNCIINAYVLSALSMEGSRTSERQIMASHWLISTASLAFAYASPCDRMHPVRPLRSLFHPAVFVSMLGQAIIHLACLVIAVKMARAAMAEDSSARQAGWEGPSLQHVKDFWHREKLKRRGLIEKEESEEDWMKMAMQLWTQPFLPNLMNTTVFLVETAQTVAILFVNYKGQPWMKGVTENRALFLSVFVVAGAVAAAAWELQPELNALIHLSPFPDDTYRWTVMALIGVTLVGTLIWDRICIAIFAPEIFKAMIQSAKQTTFKNDIWPIFVTALKVLFVFFILGTGNLILGGLAFWQYRRATREE